mmetsp:Transcript_36710/g.97133  ORF Transcript_36710/g.97133 Transcript_36710/m.97133 type:complete len:136 (+) Transcript_36710:7750-8157(+)
MSWVHGCISTALDNPPAELRGLESTGLRGTTPSPSLQPSLQGGGGRYMDTPSPPSANAAADFLQRRAGFSEEEARATRERSILSTLKSLTALQGCKLWDVPADILQAELSKEQNDLVGRVRAYSRRLQFSYSPKN